MRKKVLAEKSVEQGLNQFQFVELLRSNDTERVRAVTKRSAPSTHCQRRLAAKFQFVELLLDGIALRLTLSLRGPLARGNLL